MRKRRETEIVGTQLRIREGLRQRVLRASEKSGRSLNAELVYRIEQSFAYDEEKEDLRKREEKVLERLDKADERTETADRVYHHVLEAVDIVLGGLRSDAPAAKDNKEKEQ